MIEGIVIYERRNEIYLGFMVLSGFFSELFKSNEELLVYIFLMYKKFGRNEINNWIDNYFVLLFFSCL